MIEINLVPDVKQELIKAQRIRATVISVSVIVTIASGIILALLASYVFGVQTVRSSLADSEITTKNKEVQSNQDLSKLTQILVSKRCLFMIFLEKKYSPFRTSYQIYRHSIVQRTLILEFL